jgi:hypothetical protein
MPCLIRGWYNHIETISRIKKSAGFRVSRVKKYLVEFYSSKGLFDGFKLYFRSSHFHWTL